VIDAGCRAAADVYKAVLESVDLCADDFLY
jgi:hypothetical protein